MAAVMSKTLHQTRIRCMVLSVIKAYDRIGQVSAVFNFFFHRNLWGKVCSMSSNGQLISQIFFNITKYFKLNPFKLFRDVTKFHHSEGEF